MGPIVSTGAISLCALLIPEQDLACLRLCPLCSHFLSSVQIVLRDSGVPVIRDLVDYGLGVVTAVGSSGVCGSGAPAPEGGSSPKYSATERSK